MRPAALSVIVARTRSKGTAKAFVSFFPVFNEVGDAEAQVRWCAALAALVRGAWTGAREAREARGEGSAGLVSGPRLGRGGKTTYLTYLIYLPTYIGTYYLKYLPNIWAQECKEYGKPPIGREVATRES